MAGEIEIKVMSKALANVPLTEIPIGCPCCEEELIISVRVAEKEISVGLMSKKQRTIQEAILQAAGRWRRLING